MIEINCDMCHCRKPLAYSGKVSLCSGCFKVYDKHQTMRSASGKYANSYLKSIIGRSR